MVSRPQAISEQDLRDLGFGAVVSRESQQRLLNRDGSFNVERKGLTLIESISPYHLLLTMPWSHFFALCFGWYVLANRGFRTGLLGLRTGSASHHHSGNCRGSFLAGVFLQRRNDLDDRLWKRCTHRHCRQPGREC